MSIRVVEYWEKRLFVSQRRYLRVSETLARVRKLPSNTQMLKVIIATDKRQQVNVAGDVIQNNEI